MQQPVQITFKDIPQSDAVELHLREHVDKLEQFSQNLISCHVLIEQTQKHQSQGKLYSIHLKLTMPGRELIANRNEQENLYVSIRDAFDDMREQIVSYKQQLSGHVKNHAEVLHGKIVRLYDIDEFGFIRSTNGDEYYFNAGNMAKTKFDRLDVGTEVSFIEALGDDGLQAHRVSAKKLRE